MAKGDDLVFVATAPDPVMAAAMRGFLEGHGVFCHVQGENHSSILGARGVVLIDLRLLVPERDRDKAIELLEAFAAEAEVDGEEAEPEEEGEPRSLGGHGLSGRRNPRTATVLALVPSFGFGHMYARAFFRGMFLFTTEVVGITLLPTRLWVGITMIGLAIVTDALGGPVRAREFNAAFDRRVDALESGASDDSALPQARIRSPRD
jgi:hypothetical protein